MYSTQGRVRRLMLPGVSGFLLLAGGCPLAQPPAGEAPAEPGAALSELADTAIAAGGPATIKGMQPESAVGDGQVFVMIEGTGFEPGMEVLFGRTPASEVLVVNERMLTALTPPLALGNVEVTVRAPDGAEVAWAQPFVVVPDDCWAQDPTDTDGDGLSDCLEVIGYEIRVDAVGFGIDPRFVGAIIVTSDPHIADTDGDGLSDVEEYDNRCNPRLRDSDGDRLHDHEEVYRWLTSPVSIDTDGDARGPDGDLPPNASLFDGNELKTVGFVGNDELYFSEYVEGSGDNRALELYNGTRGDVDLAAGGYELAFGQPGAETVVPLSGVIAAGRTFVIADEQARRKLRKRADALLPLPFDGVTAVTLRRGGEVIDAIGGVPRLGDATLDQASAVINTGNIVAHGRWQTFTAGQSGPLSRIELFVNNTSHSTFQPFAMSVARDGQAIGGTSTTIPPNFYGWWTLPLDATGVEAGATYTLTVVSPSGVVDLAIDYNDPYPGGASSEGPNSDIAFRTYVAAAVPWGDGDTTTRDHTLVRRRGVCGGDGARLHASNPRAEWIGLPIDTFDGLGLHSSACPTRIVRGGTSPTLDDTDGDGQSDYEEYDDPLRSTRIAELPRVQVETVGELDIRLNVEYEESLGTEEQYGSSISRETSHALSQSIGSAMARTVEASASVSVESEVGFPEGGSVSVGVEESVSESLSTEFSFSTTSEQSATLQSESSRYLTDSVSKTVASAAGAIRLGMRITNTGFISYNLTNLGVTVLQWESNPSYDPQTSLDRGQFRTLATLVPTLAADFTLAPGESTPVIEVAADDLDAGLVRQFLARPHSLYFETPSFEIENAEGLNFAFLDEVSYGRTANVVIDYGNGRAESFRIATNVNRLPDSTFAGVTLGEVMEMLQGDDFATAEKDADPAYRVLTRVGDTATFADGDSKGFWAVLASERVQLADAAGRPLDFESIVLHNGDSVHVVYTQDLDGDGLYAAEEYTFGASDLNTDSDGDGLDDFAEVNTGWTVNDPELPANRYPRHVTADPASADADQDGWTDARERRGRDNIEPGAPGDSGDATDPTNPDTDGDGQLDGADPHPTIPAKQLFVNQNVSNPGDGTDWGRAFETLQDALAAAHARNFDGDPRTNIGEIWVAQGSYTPGTDRADTFQLVPRVNVFGGFGGWESKRAQRDADPYTNGTILSGDLAGDDSTGGRTDNAYHVVTAGPAANDVILDGFTIRGGNADTGSVVEQSGGGIQVRTHMFLRNILFFGNRAGYYGGAVGTEIGGFGVTVEGCVFQSNTAVRSGGAVHALGDARIADCEFLGNWVEVGTTEGRGGALTIGSSLNGGDAVVERCLFEGNVAAGGVQQEGGARGGGVCVDGSGPSIAVLIRDCAFRNNRAWWRGGGLALMAGASVTVVNSTFWENRAENLYGGGISHEDEASRLTVLNCTVMNNRCDRPLDGVGLYAEGYHNVFVLNSIFWGNRHPDSGFLDEIQIGPPHVFKQYSCVEGGSYPLLADDPRVQDATLGDLRLSADSPCIDAGSRLVDANPFVTGPQPLPGLDLLGNVRIVDGLGDGRPQVDIGAYEYQPGVAAP